MPLRLIILYAVVIIAGALPLVFRGRYWLRVICILLLGLVALLHLVFLDAEFRLVGDRAAAMNGGLWPTDYKIIRSAVRDVSQSEVPLTALLFVSFVALALLPYRRS
jgi:hypothetical protein